MLSSLSLSLCIDAYEERDKYRLTMCVRAGAYAEREWVRVCVCVNDAQVDHISDMPRPITCDAGKKTCT